MICAMQQHRQISGLCLVEGQVSGIRYNWRGLRQVRSARSRCRIICRAASNDEMHFRSKELLASASEYVRFGCGGQYLGLHPRPLGASGIDQSAGIGRGKNIAFVF